MSRILENLILINFVSVFVAFIERWIFRGVASHFGQVSPPLSTFASSKYLH